MELRAFNYGANAVCYDKNGHRYGMICAWATQVDYDKVVMLLGAQSGVSVLSSRQKDVMDVLGSDHSDEVDKFASLDFSMEDTAILINDASINMVVEVIDILHLPGIEEDNLIYGLIKSYTKSDKPMLTI
jgi:flavin reductase (DIM6/NTAB) family NADH-FMN oxidoreductase RutF